MAKNKHRKRAQKPKINGHVSKFHLREYNDTGIRGPRWSRSEERAMAQRGWEL